MELIRVKNVATYVVFPLKKDDGSLLSSAAGLDSVIDSFTSSNAPDGFTDCTNEATEIGSTGIYYLSLSQSECNVDQAVILVNSSSSGAIPQVILINFVSTPPAASAVADAVWDEAISEHTTSSAFGGTNQKVVPSETIGDYKADLSTLEGRLTATRAGYLDVLADLINAGRLDLLIDAIKAKTDNLPASPAAVGSAMVLSSAYDAAKSAASQSSLNVLDDYVDTEVAAILVAVDTEVAAIKAKTDNLPASPAAVGSKMDLADSLSSTGLGVMTSAVWSRLLTDISTSGSIGKLIKDYLDAAISSRLAAASYTVPPTVGAIADQVFDELLSGHTTAGSAGKALSDASALSVSAIDAQLSASHGASAWGASAVGSITYPNPEEDPQPFLDPEGDPLAGVKIEAYSDEDRTTLVDVQVTNINGLFAFHLDAGTYYFRAILAGYGNFEWSVELTA